MKTEDGDVYGPVPRAELDDWFLEGRVNADCQVQLDGESAWRSAADLFPELADESAATTPAPAAQSTSAVEAQGRSRRKASRAPVQNAGRSDVDLDASDSTNVDDSRIPDGGGETSDRRWITTFLLAFFLGTLGIHRFYLGRVLSGVAMLFTCGGCFIWQIVDVVSIALEKLPDHLGRPLHK